MKLLCLAVSLVAAFRVEPGPDSQHSIIAEQPQMPEFTVPPGDSEETNSISDEQPLGPGFDIGPEDSEEISLNTTEQPQGPGFTPVAEQPQGPGFNPIAEEPKGNAIISEPQLFDLEEEEGQRELELRGSGCKAKPSCSIPGGYCVDNATSCNPGRLVSAGCKGSCQCCIPECSEKQGYFRPTGSYQCFKMFADRTRNWAAAGAHCKANGMVLAHPSDAVSLRSYMVQTFGYYYHVWLNARGSGSYLRWQDTSKYILNYNPMWYTGHPGSRTSSSYCLMLLVHSYHWNLTATQPYYSYSCSGGYYTLCQVTW